MIDHGFTSGGQINRAFALLMLVAVVLALATAARFFFVSLLGEKVVADLRSRLYAHLIQLGAGFHDRSRSGELVSRLTADSELLRSVVGSTMSVALRSSVTVVGSLAMLFVTSPRLAAWSLLGIPLAVLPIIIGARKLRTVARSSQDRIADANSLASETLGAVRTVQAHAREPYERGRFDKALGDAIGAARRRIGAQSLVTASAILLVFGAIVGVLWLGAHDVIDGRLSAGTLGQFVLYALIGGGSVAPWPKCGTSCSVRPVAWAVSASCCRKTSRSVRPRSMHCRNRYAAKSSSTTWCSTTRSARTRPRWTTSICMSARVRPWPWSARRAQARARCCPCCWLPRSGQRPHLRGWHRRAPGRSGRAARAAGTGTAAADAVRSQCTRQHPLRQAAGQRRRGRGRRTCSRGRWLPASIAARLRQ